MCGRFSLHAHPGVIALQFALSEPPAFTPHYNIAPTLDVLVIREDAAHVRHAELRKWGLVPYWAKDPKIGAKLANARAESVAEKPAFRSAFRRARCIVPASGFYEWRTIAGKKQPYYIRPAGEGVFGLAGLMERWGEGDDMLRTCALITTEPNELMATIHDRMPVILAPEDYARWLDTGAQNAAAVSALESLLRPYPAEQMLAFPVSRKVNVVKNNEPDNLEPVEI